ncbi:MAG: 4-hydroxythreonine-4-phosphate dehydrogenase PdxA [Bacteriovoracia bacterium]
MKVYVTQGHEKGIGLEVFFKSCLLIPGQDLRQLKLLAFRKSVRDTLLTLNLPFNIEDDAIHLAGICIDVSWIEEVSVSESFTALELGMKLSESSGVLFTLPTSKDQFPGYPGHTEFFRASYHRSDLGMFFSSPSLQVLLLSDHVPVSALSNLLSEEMMATRLSTALKTFKQWQWPINRILVSGFNPHAGESGLIGNEDDRVKRVIKRLSSSFKIDMAGPFPGDTMLLEKKSPKDLLVYLFHDQGLGVFKGQQGFIGSNITLGLPFPRFSPDHGTSFSLYGKNQSDYRGCEFALKEAVNMLKKVSNGKNSSHKSKST